MRYPIRWAMLAALAAAPAEVADPIAAQADACLATPQGQTESGMAQCSHQAYLAYDKQMNELYQRVLKSVDPKSAGLIRAAQRCWLAYREAQRAADQAPWQADRGSMVAPDIEALNVDAIRHRIAELRYYAP